MRLFVLLAVLLLASPGLAQQQTPSEQALGTKLLQEIQGGLSCSADLIAVRAELVKANARIKELEEKK